METQPIATKKRAAHRMSRAEGLSGVVEDYLKIDLKQKFPGEERNLVYFFLKGLM